MTSVPCAWWSQPDQAHNPYDCTMYDAEPSPAFADLISTARRDRGMSQEDLETASGVSRGTISRWERGLSDRPEAEHVRAVCRALGIDPRRAAISLGFLTVEEVEGPQRLLLDPEVEEVLNVLQDPNVDQAEKKAWIEYLKYLQAKTGQLPVREAG